ncbi:MAG: sulfatase family protein [Planctomycetota bacterium]
MSNESPNIVYILADDMGYGDVSCLNPESRIRTEHLDRLAAEGMRFEDAHASSAVCTPSRYSILTGRYNWRSRQKRGVLGGYSEPLIEAGRMTVASYLKSKGYRTGCFGKWHLGWSWAKKSDDAKDVDFTRPITGGPTDAGFDEFFGIAASLDMAPYVYVDGEMPTAVPDRVTSNTGKAFWREGPTAPDFRHDEVLEKLTDRCCSFIRDNAGAQPLFVYFPLPAPHTPILPTDRFLGTSGTNEYGDFCLLTDWCIGEVMRAVEDAGIAEDTLFIFAADNGCSPEANFDELAKVGHHPSYHFRGYKADIYEGGHRIPLIVRWPRRIGAGRRCAQTVCLSDLLATAADIHGDALPDDAGEDSVSNLPLYSDAPPTEPIRQATVHHSIQGMLSIRQGRWKLEMCPGSGGWSPPRPGDEPPDAASIQLYDLEADIGERRNVVAEHPDVVDRLTALLTRYVRDGRSTPGAPQPNTGPRYWPQLNWLSENEM